jgi:hypothetical protein
MDFISQIIDARTGEQFISVEEARTVIGTDKVSLLLNSASILPYFPVLISIKSKFKTPGNEITVSREMAIYACKHILFKSVKVDRVATLQNIRNKVNSEVTLKTMNHVTVVTGNQITYTIHSLYDYKIALKMPVPHEIFPFLVVFNHTYHSFPTSDTFLKLEDIRHFMLISKDNPPQPKPSLENNPIYKIEIRNNTGLDVYFGAEKSLVTGRPSEFLLTLIQHQSQEVDFRFFSNMGEGGQPDYESGLYEEDIYESNDTNFKPYQAHLDELYVKRDFAIEGGNRAQIDSVISEIAKFEVDIVKKTRNGFIDDDGQIAGGRKILKREFRKEINRLVKQKTNLLKQLQPKTKAHFTESLKTGIKLSYSPEHPIDWKIIQ